MPLPSAKSKPPEQKDQKKQKSLLGWLSKPVANSSSALNAPSLASSSPSGRDSTFETPSTKRRTGQPAVTSATYTKSSDGGRSFNETPPTSDPIDVDMSSDEDLPRRDTKSVCVTYTYAYTLLVTWSVSQARSKRKITIEDSDEREGCDNTAAIQRKGLSAYKSFKEPGNVTLILITGHLIN
jgi:DNA mismatch repair protein MSH6